MSDEERKASDFWIADKIISLPEWYSASSVFCYVSLADEADTYRLMEKAIDCGKMLCVPLIVADGIMEAVELKSVSDLFADKFGIPTAPSYYDDYVFIDPKEIDFAVVPGAAFARNGKRIGMGGGYYDRFLGRFGGVSAGIAHSCQIYEDIPVDEWDKSVDMVIFPLSNIQSFQAVNA